MIVPVSCDTVGAVNLSMWFVLALLLPGCLAVPPARAPAPSPALPDPEPVPIPARASGPEHERLAECPIFTGKGQACGGGLGQVCTRDDNGCERCECKPSPGSDGQTVDEHDLDPRQ